MKKAIITALALTFLAAPVMTASQASAQVFAQSRQDIREDRRELRQDRRELRQDRREVRRDIRQDRRQASRPNWLRNGGRYSGPRQYVDHRRYGLRAPRAGQRWVRYNNDYVLVTIASGLIAGILAAQ